MMVYSIFTSINGEANANHQGSLTTFIRMSGCNLRCTWCDTLYAQGRRPGMFLKVDQLVGKCTKLGLRNVTITGGEPLMQSKSLVRLMRSLLREGFRVCVETNGSYRLPDSPVVDWVVDCKLPSSGMTNRNVYQNYSQLKNTDFIKFVVQTRLDFEFAAKMVQHMREAGCRAKHALSPVIGRNGLEINQLITWMKERRLDAILSVQLHKLLKIKESP